MGLGRGSIESIPSILIRVGARAVAAQGLIPMCRVLSHHTGLGGTVLGLILAHRDSAGPNSCVSQSWHVGPETGSGLASLH